MLRNSTIKLSLTNEHVWSLSLILFFAINMNYDWRKGYLAWYGCLAFVFAAYLLFSNGRILLKRLSFFSWLFSFVVWCVISLAWSLSVSTGMGVVKSFVIFSTVLLLIQCSLLLGYQIDTLLRCYLIATLINAIYVTVTIDMAALGEVQLGGQMLEGWNGNGIGFMTAQGFLIGYYLFKTTKNKHDKCFLFLCVIVFTVMTLYTGSRTAFIMLLAELVLYYWLSHPTKVVRNVMVSALVLIGAFYLVINVEVFYNVLGSRLEGLFALFGGEGEIDSSANLRDLFIENGKRWFSERPILGYGINNYKVLNQEATGRFTYAHNTFIELAVDLGVVGLVWYYSAYAYLIAKLVKLIKRGPIYIFLLSALIASFASQYGTVKYYDFYQNMLILLCFFAVAHARKERRAKL